MRERGEVGDAERGVLTDCGQAWSGVELEQSHQEHGADPGPASREIVDQDDEGRAHRLVGGPWTREVRRLAEDHPIAEVAQMVRGYPDVLL